MIASRFTDAEKKLVEQTFKSRENIVVALRNAFLGFELTEEETKLIASVNSEDVRAVLRKIIYPELLRDTPVGMEVDIWTSFAIGSLQEYPIAQAATAKIQAMIEMAFKWLEDQSGPRPATKVNPGIAHADLLARNNYIKRIIQPGLLTLEAIANAGTEDVKEYIERMQKNSNQ